MYLALLCGSFVHPCLFGVCGRRGACDPLALREDACRALVLAAALARSPVVAVVVVAPSVARFFSVVPMLFLVVMGAAVSGAAVVGGRAVVCSVP